MNVRQPVPTKRFGYILARMKTCRVFLTVMSLLFGFAIVVTAQNEKSDNVDPPHALWAAMKRALSAPDGEKYFQENVKDSALPMLIGTVISSSPSDRPSLFVVAITDAATREVTLRLTDDAGKEAHLNSPVMQGSQIRFEGVGAAFTKEPFMLTLEVSTSFRKPRKR